VEDLSKIFSFEPKPQVLVVGTGYYGILKISNEAEEALKSRGIELVAQPTKDAVKTFNKLLGLDKRVAGAFHRTC
jgi:hypothetical protein